MALKIKPLWLFSFISLVLVLIWYRSGNLFAGGEEGIIFYDLKKHRELISSVWYDIEVGLPVVAFLARIPYFFLLSFLSGFLSPVILQAFTFWLLLTVGSLSVCFLANEFFSEKLPKVSKNSLAYTAGFFYIFNPYSMTQVWGRGLYPQFFAFAFAPLFLLLFIKFLKERRLYYLIIASLVSIFFASAFVIITNVVVVWAIIFLYLLYYLFQGKDKKEVLSAFGKFFLFLTSWVLVNAWWIIPSFRGVEIYATSISSSSRHENIGTLLGVSAHFPLNAILRLMQRYYFFIAKSYGEIYSTLPFTIISWLPPVFTLFSLFYFRKLKIMKFIVIVFLLGLVVSLGANRPFGKVFILFFETFPVLQAFRNPYEKFGLVFMFAYSFLFALGLERLTFKKLKLRLAVLVLVCGIFVLPLWTGSFAGQYAWIDVPDYYKSVDRWLNSQGGDFRIIQFPLVSGDGVKYNWERPYQGIEPGAFLFSRQSIGRNVGVKGFYNVLLQRFGNFSPGIFGPDPDITNSDFREEHLWEELAKLNVRYIVFHNDLDDAGIGNKVTTEDFRNYINAEQKIKKVKSFGALDIYEVDIPESVALIYSPGAKVSYKKLRPTHYIGEITDGRSMYLEVYLLNFFNDGWEMFVDGKKLDNHFVAYSYANGWRVDYSRPFTFEIKYKPQEAADLGAKISIIALVILLTTGIALSMKKKSGIKFVEYS